MRYRLGLLGGILSSLVFVQGAHAVLHDVNTLADTVDASPGDGVCADAGGSCSLRAAVQEANGQGGSSAIRLQESAQYVLALAGAGEDAGATGDLDVLADVRIQGRGARVDAAGLDRAFDVHAGGILDVRDLTVTNGFVVGESGGAYRSAGELTLLRSAVTNGVATGPGASGGAIFNDGGVLTVERSALSGGSAERAGGAIEAAGGVTVVRRSVLADNETGPNPGNGGALHLTGAGVVEVLFTRVEANVAAREGGGLWNSATGTMRVDRTEVVGNEALGTAADDGGGGLFNDGGRLEVTRSVVSDNRAVVGSGSGGGLFNNGGELHVDRTDVGGNASNRAGGGVEALGGTTVVTRSSLVDNETGPSPGNGGGLHLTGAGEVRIDRAEVHGNHAAAEGGGAWNSATGGMEVTRSTFSDNVASGAGADQGGGALFNDGGTMVVENAKLFRNVADGASGSGGGILNGLGTLVVSDSKLAGNVSRRAGGGIEANVGTTELHDVDLEENATGPAPGNGGGLHLTGPGRVEIGGGRVVSNEASAEGGGLWNSSTGTMIVTDAKIAKNAAPLGPDVFNDGGFFTVDGANVPPGP